MGNGYFTSQGTQYEGPDNRWAELGAGMAQAYQDRQLINEKKEMAREEKENETARQLAYAEIAAGRKKVVAQGTPGAIQVGNSGVYIADVGTEANKQKMIYEKTSEARDRAQTTVGNMSEEQIEKEMAAANVTTVGGLEDFYAAQELEGQIMTEDYTPDLMDAATDRIRMNEMLKKNPGKVIAVVSKGKDVSFDAYSPEELRKKEEDGYTVVRRGGEPYTSKKVEDVGGFAYKGAKALKDNYQKFAPARVQALQNNFLRNVTGDMYHAFKGQQPTADSVKESRHKSIMDADYSIPQNLDAVVPGRTMFQPVTQVISDAAKYWLTPEEGSK